MKRKLETMGVPVVDLKSEPRPMRAVFHAQLDRLTALLGEMCAVAGAQMKHATQALLKADQALADEVILGHDRLVELNRQAEESSMALLALQAPVAGDLRVVVGSLQSGANAERMGSLALHVAKIARRRYPAHALPEEVNGHFAEMGRIAVDLSNSAREAVLRRDPVRASQIHDDDNAMDRLHRYIFIALMDREWAHDVAATVDVTLLGRFYERFADHAVQIGRRVIFQATGQTAATGATKTKTPADGRGICRR
jgi:phosphate transport system protein